MKCKGINNEIKAMDRRESTDRDEHTTMECAKTSVNQ